MASNGVDPTTGAPRFPESDAPQLGTDYQIVADYAASVGTRLIGTTEDRLAYAYAREGLRWYDTDNSSEYLYKGSGWVLWSRGWTTYTPTLTNISGAPTVNAEYAIASGVVFVRVAIALVGANFGTAPTLSLPVTAATPHSFEPAGDAGYWDISGGTLYPGRVQLQNATTFAFLVITNPMGTVSATLPFTWASGDLLRANLHYKAA